MDSLPTKRIAFISARNGFIKGPGKFLMDSANGRLIYELARVYRPHFSVAIFNDSIVRSKYSLEIEVAAVYALPFPLSYWGGLKNSLRIYTLLKRIECEHDLLIIQLPFVSFFPIFFLTKPVVFHVCANVLTGASNRIKYSMLKRVLAQSFSKLIHKSFKTFFNKKRNSVIVNGGELGQLYSDFNPIVAVSSSIYSHEIIDEALLIRRNTAEEFRILFIGRPAVDKGYGILMTAFMSMVDRGYAVSLVMLGAEKNELSSLSKTNIPERYLQKIHALGFVPWGNEFKKIVMDCHCLVMSSLSGEGTPRVLLEARALGCPVIATDVGGVSSSITHNYDGIIVPIGKSDPIANSVINLLKDEEDRTRLRINGLKTAQYFTVETFSGLFIQQLNKILKHEA